MGETAHDVNLVVGWTEIWPHPLYCGVDARIQAPVVNTGQSWFDTEDHKVSVTVRNVHVSSGIVTDQRTTHVGPSQLGPGARQFIDVGPLNVDVYINELHRVEVIVDSDNEVIESNEGDNYWASEYIMSLVPGRDSCGAASLNFKFRGCGFWFTQDYKGSDPAVIAAIRDLEEAVRYADVPSGEQVRVQLTATPDDKDYLVREIAAALRQAVSPERWEILEDWFFMSATEIVHVLAPQLVQLHPYHSQRSPERLRGIPDRASRCNCRF